MWTQQDYTPGSISQLLSGSTGDEKKTKRKKSKRESVPDGVKKSKLDGEEEARHPNKSNKIKKEKNVDIIPNKDDSNKIQNLDDIKIEGEEAKNSNKSKKSKEKKNADKILKMDSDNEDNKNNIQNFHDVKNNLKSEEVNNGIGKKKNKKRKKSKSKENINEGDKNEVNENKRRKLNDTKGNPSPAGTENILTNNDENESKKSKKIHKRRPDDPDELKKTVFVGNVPVNYTIKDVSRIFSEFGPVSRARLRCIPVAKLGMSKKEAVCRKQFHPKRNSMTAYVVFKSEESVRAALEKNGMLADGHHLRIDLPNREKEYDIKKAIFVGGLPFDVEDDEVWEVFEKCGEIENVRIVRDNNTMIGKGFGYVNFKSSASVELALELDGQEIRTRKINVKRCMKIKKKKMFKRAETLKVKKRSENFKKSKKEKFDLSKVKVTASQIGSTGQFQGSKAGKEKKKKKKKLSQNELRRRKVQKILAPSSGSGKKKVNSK